MLHAIELSCYKNAGTNFIPVLNKNESHEGIISPISTTMSTNIQRRSLK